MSVSRRTTKYWEANGLYRDSFTNASGQRQLVPDYSVRIHFDGNRGNFPLRTSNKAQAAEKARDIYCSLEDFGWEATMAEFRPGRSIGTVGDYLKALEEKSDIPTDTLEGYGTALRGILAFTENIPFDQKLERDARKNAWREKLHGLRLSVLTHEKLVRFQKEFVARVGNNPIKRKRAANSAESMVRRARALFSPKRVRAVGLLEFKNPFAEIELKKQDNRYESRISVGHLLEMAETELRGSEPEQYKIFLLGLTAGLRKAEIDYLEWSAFHWDEGYIRIDRTEWFEPKSPYSIGNVRVDAKLLEIFAELRKATPGDFVVQSTVPPGSEGYRCETHFDRFNKWLRSKGVKELKPLHTLRKEFGSKLAKDKGILAAANGLRQSGTQTAYSNYVCKNIGEAPGFF